LALRARQLDKAGQYIQNSLDIEPSVEAFRLMGDVLLQQDQAVKACVFFRNGLLYASNEAIAQVEEIQGVESLDASLARSPLAEMNV
jgi:HemY protein